MIAGNILVPSTSAPQETILMSEVYLAEGQLLLEEQTSNKQKSPIYRSGAQRPTVLYRGGLK
jgi:hypothetical protein